MIPYIPLFILLSLASLAVALTGDSFEMAVVAMACAIAAYSHYVRDMEDKHKQKEQL